VTLPTLNLEGFLLVAIADEWAMLGADFGDGFSLAALDGVPEGRRSWSLRIDALPGTGAKLAADFGPPGHVLREGAGGYVLSEKGGRLLLERALTRSAYLWSFFQYSKAAADQPFWIEVEDPETGTRKNYLAAFVDHKISYAVLCAQIYSTGIELIERRVPPGITVEEVRP
jgi:hypothetical protein